MSNEDDQPKLSVPMVVWPFIGVAALFVIAVGVPLMGGTVRLTVPKADLEEGHLITYADLVTKEWDQYGLGKVATSRSQVVGRVTQTALGSDEPIPVAALTGKVPSDYSRLTRVRFRTEHSATVDVENGDRVKLLFAPTVASEAPAPAVIHAVLLDVTEDGDAHVYFVATAPGDRDALLRLVGRSRLLVTSG